MASALPHRETSDVVSCSFCAWRAFVVSPSVPDIARSTLCCGVLASAFHKTHAASQSPSAPSIGLTSDIFGRHAAVRRDKQRKTNTQVVAIKKNKERQPQSASMKNTAHRVCAIFFRQPLVLLAHEVGLISKRRNALRVSV